MPSVDEYYTFEEVHERGWHYGTIHRLFPRGASKTTYRDHQRVDLYRSSVVHQLEASRDFDKIQAEVVADSKQRAKEELKQAYALQVRIQAKPIQQLKQAALARHNRRKDDPTRPPLIVPSGFWEKIMVDYLITEHSQQFAWEHYRKNPMKKVEEIKTEKILQAIAAAYPDLQAECQTRLRGLRPPTSPRTDTPNIQLETHVNEPTDANQPH